MWLFTTDGFYSVVQDKDDPDRVVVRARTAEDMARFAMAVGYPGEWKHTPKADYAYRLIVARDLFIQWTAEQAAKIDYPNFKDAVQQRQGVGRAFVYSGVWDTVRRGLQRV